MGIKIHYIYKIKQLLEEKGQFEQSKIESILIERKQGKKLTFKDHLKALIYALLSNQRYWNKIEPLLQKIDEIFYQYDACKIQEKSDSYFYSEIVKIKAGNRQLKKQMKALFSNINTLKMIESEYGTLDDFVLNCPMVEVVKKLSQAKSKYKLKQVGVALACEYLRNVGVDGVKPDIHLRRFLGNARMGSSKKAIASEWEVFEQTAFLHKNTELTYTAIDAIIWRYCAKGYLEICGEDPECEKCCCREECKYQRK